MSSEEPDLPVAAKFEDGKEFVGKSDAEETIKEAREEARREERQRILDKIDKEIKSTKKAAENAGVQVHDLYGTTAITALENLQDELEEEAEA